jgi:hypothetical protein
MFRVSDTFDFRKNKILGFLNQNEGGIAIILAVTNFEWTLRRSIIILSKNSSYECRKELTNCSGIDNYKKLWNKLVLQHIGKTLPQLIVNWEMFRDSYRLRHRLVHGIIGTTGIGYTAERVNLILDATLVLVNLVESSKTSVYKRLKTIK